jgi:phenylacetate-CoA ligase
MVPPRTTAALAASRPATRGPQPALRPYWDEGIETLPRRDLERLQASLLREHLDHAYRGSRWYRRAFDSAGVAPGDVRTIADVARLPFVDKRLVRDRQVAAPLLGDLAAVDERDVVYVSASSGSTGVPTLSPFTAEDFDHFQDVQARLFWATGLRPQDRYCHALNFSLFVGGPDVIGAQRVGALCIWAGALPTDRLLLLLRQLRPTVSWTTPSYAWHLGEAAVAAGLDPARDLSVRTVLVAGEPGGSISATRRAIESPWEPCARLARLVSFRLTEGCPPPVGMAAGAWTWQIAA